MNDLLLHIVGADPLSKRRTRDSQACVVKHGFLTVQRQMVGKLRVHDVGQQTSGLDALVDHLRWDLDQ